jgi:hypothetical protein
MIAGWASLGLSDVVVEKKWSVEIGVVCGWTRNESAEISGYRKIKVT